VPGKPPASLGGSGQYPASTRSLPHFIEYLQLEGTHKDHQGFQARICLFVLFSPQTSPVALGSAAPPAPGPPPLPPGSRRHPVSSAQPWGQRKRCQLHAATGAKDVLPHGSAPSGTGSGWGTAIPSRACRRGSPSARPSPGQTPELPAGRVPCARASVPRPRQLPVAAQSFALGRDRAGCPRGQGWHPANGTWRVASLGKSKSWRCGHSRAQCAPYSPAWKPRASAPVISSPL